MKSLRSRIKKSNSPINEMLEYEDSNSISIEENKHQNQNKYKNRIKMDHSHDEILFSDLEKENQKNLLEAKKLIQKTKNIIKGSNKLSFQKNKSFDATIMKTSISNRGYSQSDRNFKSHNVSTEEINNNMIHDEYQLYSRPCI